MSIYFFFFLLIKNGHLSDAVIQTLWGVFAGKASWAGQQDVKYALMLLSMIGRVNSEVLRSKVPLLMKHGLLSSDLVLARYCCGALHRLASTNKNCPTQQRYPPSHALFEQLKQLMAETIIHTSTSQWCPFSEAAIGTVYLLADQPDSVIEDIIHQLCRVVFGGQATAQSGDMSIEDADLSSSLSGRRTCMVALSRLLFAAGHAAQKQLVYLEGQVCQELKKRRMKDDKEDKNDKSDTEVRD